LSSDARTRDRVVVPFLDLAAIHAPLKKRVLEAVGSLIDSNAFVNGPAVAEFESEFAAYCGSRACVGTASGLDALRLGLIALGIEAGDEVLVPANTFIATTEAVTQAGGTPVLVEMDERDYNLDVAAARAAVTERTRFLLPVHLYGQLADMRALGELAEARGLQIVEDACQAHGASRDGLRAGSAGAAAAAFSFYPGKNLGAMGDAGALTTQSEDVAARVRALREHGQRRKYEHDVEGYTARLDTIQALVLREKLALLDDWNEQRRQVAAFYASALEAVGDLTLPPVPVGSNPVWHLYVVRTEDPQALAEHLALRGISTGRHYPIPLHVSPAYTALGHAPGDFPLTEEHARRVLSLPIFPGITEPQLEAVSSAIAEFFDRP
jgi:dTDP-4-amino-4,6-dideoxygalactose transaminase